MRSSRLVCTLLPALAAVWAAATCSETTAPRRGLGADLVGPDSFAIVDQPVNPGCHYYWILQARSDAITLIGGRMISMVGSVPGDTIYLWDRETIAPLFGEPTIPAGERMQSDGYSTVGDSLPSFDFETEFNFTGPGGDTGVVRQRISCVRGLRADSSAERR